MSNPTPSAFSQLRATHRSARRQSRLNRILSKYAFQGPLQQAVRWHLFYDGRRIISVLAQAEVGTTSWSAGPPIEPAELANAEQLQIRVKELIQGLRPAVRNHKSLALILHLADNIDVAIVNEQFENPELFTSAIAQIRETPSDVVTDLAASEKDPAVQWRYYPLLSGQRAVALRHDLEFFTAFQNLTHHNIKIGLANLDIKIAVHSAAIETIAIYLQLYKEAIEEKPHCFVFYYDQFTMVLAANGGVLDLKVLPHQNQDVPPAFGDDMFSLLESHGLVASCVLLLIQCGTQEPTRLFHELDAYARRKHKSADNIDIQIPDKDALWSFFEKLAPGQIKPEVVMRPEFLSEYLVPPTKEMPASIGIESDAVRFALLSADPFWPDDSAARNKQLPKSMALAISALNVMKIAGALSLLLLSGFLVLAIINAARANTLHLTPDMLALKSVELKQLQDTRQYVSIWDKILTPRSQAWSTLDFFLGLLPEGPDLISDRLKYTIRQADPKPGVADGPGGFSRQWSVEGSCTDAGRSHLESLREASTIARLFNTTAIRLHDPSFEMLETRTVKVVLREETNPQFGGANSTALPYQFRLIVTQSLPGNDPVAFVALPKPKTGKPPG
jgi:hypothetical protein